MRCTISHARAQLGELVTRAQDPRQVINLTRHDEGADDIGFAVALVFGQVFDKADEIVGFLLVQQKLGFEVICCR